MSISVRHGVPAGGAALAATSFTAPAPDCRVTIIPSIPLVPVRGLLAKALTADTAERSVLWVDVPAEAGPSELWEAVRAGAAGASGLPLEGDAFDAFSAWVTALDAPLLLVLTLVPTMSQDVDAQLLSLLATAPQLHIAAICEGRRLLEGLGRADHGGQLVPPANLVLQPAQIADYLAHFDIELDAIELAHVSDSPLVLPDVLPAVLATLDLDGMDPDDLAHRLVEECESYLAMRLRAAPTGPLTRLLPLAVPVVLTSTTLTLVSAGTSVHLERASQAGIVQREAETSRFHLQPMLRRVLLAEFEQRDPGAAAALNVVLGEHFRSAGDAGLALQHFTAAQEWDAAVEQIDEVLFRMLGSQPAVLHHAIEALPRRVRDAHPRLLLALDMSWQPREGVAATTSAIARRAAGTLSRLPDVMSNWDRVHVLLVRTAVARLKGDVAASLDAARVLDDLLVADDDLTSRAAGSLAEAHYQAGLSRLLGLDLVGARDSFTRSHSAAQALDDGAGTVRRAAEANALVRALEGEADQASAWLGGFDEDELGTAGLSARALVSIGRLDPADARHWLALLEPTADDEFWAFAVHATNRYGLYWGDPVSTDADLDRTWAEHGAQLVQGSTAHVLLTSDVADLALILGQLSRAEAALDQCTVRNTWIAVSRARLALLSSNPKHALLFILEGQRRGRTERYGQLDLAVLRAATEYALAREADATASLLRAITQSDKSGMIVPFHVLPHETLVALAGLHPEAKRFVADHDLTGTSYLAPYQAVAGALSDRELVVLRALDPGATVEQIAKKLFVASNTVKAQLRSIYRKLGVSTRTEALLVAAELGLLDEDSRTA